jgi:hypothetical protein
MRLRRSWCPRPRQNRRGNRGFDREGMAATDPAGKTRSGQRDGRSSREGRSNGESDWEGRDNDRSNEGDEGWAVGRVQPGRALSRAWQGILTPATGEA